LLQEDIEHELPVGGFEGVLQIVEQLLPSVIRDLVKGTNVFVGLRSVEDILAEVSEISEDGICMVFVLSGLFSLNFTPS